MTTTIGMFNNWQDVDAIARENKLYKEIDELKKYERIVEDLEEWLKEEQERYRDYLSTRPENDSEYNSKYATQCGLAQVDVILDKIQELKEKYK